MIKAFYSLIVVLIIPVHIYCQSFGFGCLGVVGGFAGYSYQQYKADGLNSFIYGYNQGLQDTSRRMANFNDAGGYRVGINLFRGNLQGFILTVKGYYQSLSSKRNLQVTQNSNASFDLKLKTWGIGLDLGTAITPSFSWKVIDASFLYNTANLTNTYTTLNKSVIDRYTSGSNIGYSVGTGFIYNIIESYVTLEGTASYCVLIIKDLKDDNGKPFEPSNVNFITNGGVNAVLQLNLSFPL